MQQLLKPGAELDFLTEREARAIFAEAVASLAREPSVVRLEANGKTDASGNLLLPVYNVPQGMAFVPTRLLVTIDGASFAVPFTGAGAMVEVLRNDVTIDGKSCVAAALTPAGLPALFVYSDSAADYFANGDQLAVRFTAVTASVNAIVRGKGYLQPIVAGN